MGDLGDLSPYVLAGAAVVYGLVKVLERLGWVRTPTAWREEAEALQHRLTMMDERVAQLETKLAEQDEVIVMLRAENAELRARPDFGQMMQMIEAHDKSSREVLSEFGVCLERIADRLELHPNT